jgi:hypothetical protein
MVPAKLLTVVMVERPVTVKMLVEVASGPLHWTANELTGARNVQPCVPTVGVPVAEGARSNTVLRRMLLPLAVTSDRVPATYDGSTPLSICRAALEVNDKDPFTRSSPPDLSSRMELLSAHVQRQHSREHSREHSTAHSTTIFLISREVVWALGGVCARSVVVWCGVVWCGPLH